MISLQLHPTQSALIEAAASASGVRVGKWSAAQLRKPEPDHLTHGDGELVGKDRRQFRFEMPTDIKAYVDRCAYNRGLALATYVRAVLVRRARDQLATLSPARVDILSAKATAKRDVESMLEHGDALTRAMARGGTLADAVDLQTRHQVAVPSCVTFHRATRRKGECRLFLTSSLARIVRGVELPPGDEREAGSIVYAADARRQWITALLPFRHQARDAFKVDAAMGLPGDTFDFSAPDLSPDWFASPQGLGVPLPGVLTALAFAFHLGHTSGFPRT